MPVLIVGLDKVVEGGDVLQVMASPDMVRQRAGEYREVMQRHKQKSASQLDMLMRKIKS